MYPHLLFKVVSILHSHACLPVFTQVEWHWQSFARMPDVPFSLQLFLQSICWVTQGWQGCPTNIGWTLLPTCCLLHMPLLGISGTESDCLFLRGWNRHDLHALLRRAEKEDSPFFLSLTWHHCPRIHFSHNFISNQPTQMEIEIKIRLASEEHTARLEQALGGSPVSVEDQDNVFFDGVNKEL